MWICIMLTAALGSLFWLSKEEAVKEQTVWKKPFYKGGWYLAEQLERLRRKKSAGVRKEQEAEKLAYMLMVLFVGLGAALLAETAYEGGHALGALQLTRPEKGMGKEVREFQVEAEDMTETQELQIELMERAYTEQEKRELLAEAAEELSQTVLGENASPDEVRGRVCLPAQMKEGRVQIAWYQEPTGLLDEAGNVTEELDESGELLKLRATLTCDGCEVEQELALRLYPGTRSPWEELMYQLQGALRDEDEKSASQKEFTLPQEIQGHRLIWKTAGKSGAGTVLALAVCAAVMVYFGKEREYENEKKRRRQQMILDYPDILFKLGMLLNAGLTMQNAFVKIAQEYKNGERTQKSGASERYAYEEMLSACYEMQSGVSEARAYENFGQRCNTAGYIKLGTLLSGSLQKGSQGLADLLLEEANLSMEERRQTAKQLGEEAATKLLLPMAGMLLVVLVILMAPAMMSFG